MINFNIDSNCVFNFSIFEEIYGSKTELKKLQLGRFSYELRCTIFCAARAPRGMFGKIETRLRMIVKQLKLVPGGTLCSALIVL